jgi:hypothetical protein
MSLKCVTLQPQLLERCKNRSTAGICTVPVTLETLIHKIQNFIWQVYREVPGTVGINWTFLRCVQSPKPNLN